MQDDARIVTTASRFQPWRGLQVDYPTARRRLQTSDVMERYHRAVLITDVEAGSPAEAAGLHVGDFVTHVADVPVDTPRQFHAAVDKLNDSVSLVRLDGSRVDISAASK